MPEMLHSTLPTWSSVVRHVTSLRHDLHRHPELGFEEQRTHALIARELAHLGIPVRSGLAGGTGLVATIRGDAGPGKCVALRADIDALPIQEATGLPYASTIPGRMHACGHDGHTAILLGAAAVLKSLQPSLRGTIKLVFQPAEEFGSGADRMCRDGVLNDPPVDAIFGLHGWPGLKVGTVATRPGPLLASVDSFSIELTGRGGHAASPESAIDPVLAAAATVQALQGVVSREISALDSAVLTVSQIHAGTTFNVIPDSATLGGTIRALNSTIRNQVVQALERIVNATAAAHRCRANISFGQATPATVNDPAMAAFMHNTAVETLGPDRCFQVPRPAMWGEDFAFYLERIPGCFFVLGVQALDQDSHPMLHNPMFDFNDAAIPIGIEMMVALAQRFLET